MKVLVIPDVHLKPNMFVRAIELMNQGVAEQIVCLMDIPDNHGIEHDIDIYAKSYDAAIELAKMYPNSLWCYGNHDCCYLWNERESGYYPEAAYTVQSKLMELNRILPAKNPIQYVHRIDDVLFCHGGVLDFFVEENVRGSKHDDIEYVLERINSMGRREMWNEASPIWYRPQYVNTKMYRPRKLLQVVGHTPVECIQRKRNVISCDTFSTYRDGRPIGTQEYLLIDTLTWEYQGIS